MPIPTNHTSRRNLLRSGALCAAAGAATILAPRSPSWAGPRDGTAADGVPLVTDGQAQALVVHRRDAKGQLQIAATTLVDHIALRTGVRLPLAAEGEEPADAPANRVYIGFAGPGADPTVTEQLAGLNAYGFVVAPYGSTVTILGPSEFGTQYGVQDLLEKTADVRWLTPGPLGTDVPSNPALTVDRASWHDQPAFIGRAMTGLIDSQGRDWASTSPAIQWGNQLRLHRDRVVRHALGNIFKISWYAESNPEFFPIVDGERYIPTTETTVGWNPRLSADGAVDAGVRYSSYWFEVNPHFAAYSLGVNDDAVWSEDEFDFSVRNSIGTLDASPLYYDWVNQVAAPMAQTHPDKMGTAFAYVNTYDPPPFELHPNVMVFLTIDRFGWQDPATEERDLDHLRAWQRVAKNVAWYDYWYGFTYNVPRLYTQSTARSYRLAAEHGIRHVQNEAAGPYLPEGPKRTVEAALLWDPETDVDALSREWCTRMVGTRAASCLLTYYRTWERIWRDQVPATEWYRHRPRANYYIHFFPYFDPGYLAGVTTADLTQLDRLITTTVELAQTDVQRQRAAAIARWFAYSRAAVTSFPRSVSAPETTSAALQLIDDILDGLDASIAADQERRAILAELRDDPATTDDWRDLTGVYHNWDGWNHGALWTAADHIRSHPDDADAILDRLTQRADAPGASTDVRRAALLIRQAATGQVTAHGANMSFDADTMAPWYRSELVDLMREPFGPGDVAVDDGRSLRIAGGARRIPFSQLVSGLTARETRFAMSYRCDPGVDPVGFLFLELRPIDGGGRTLGVHRSPLAMLEDGQDTWQRSSLCLDLPTGTVSARITVVVQALNWAGTVHLDDAELTQVVEQ